MKVLFILSNSESAFWLSELTHPYWHLTERGVEVDLAARTAARSCGIRTAIPTSRTRQSLTILSAKASCRTSARGETRRDPKVTGRSIWTFTTPFTWPAAAARLLTFIRTMMLRARLSISGRPTKSSARSAMARLRLEMFPIAFRPTSAWIYARRGPRAAASFRERVPHSALSADHPRRGRRGLLAARA